jgi:primosomal protein N' (replication factor Y)
MKSESADIAYAGILLPVALPEYFTYAVPPEMQGKLRPGQRVVVQFGKQRIYSGLVYKTDVPPPSTYSVKPVLEQIDDIPVVTSRQFKLWEWMAEYYRCTLGEVMVAALPSALRLQSETVILLNTDEVIEPAQLTDREYMVWEALTIKQELSITEIGAVLSLKHVMPVIKNLLAKGVVKVREDLIDKYKPLYREFIRLGESSTDDSLAKIIALLEKKAPKQLDLLLAFLHETRDSENPVIARNLLLKKSGSDAAALNALIKKGVLVKEQMEVDRIQEYNGTPLPLFALNAFQEQAYIEVKHAFSDKKVCLLHGVTSSGKTEVYLHLIRDTLAAGRQVLYILPEIALTTQMIGRMQRVFGKQVKVYHSRFNDQERAEIWTQILAEEESGSGTIVIGARSALLLPFNNLGLIIVDEEHDASYKQVDPAPRYHARDAAVVLAGIHDAATLLGSATPSIESYFNSGSGKYAMVTLDKRFAELEMPEVFVIDMQDARKRKKATGSFSQVLIDHIRSCIGEKKQVILFQNRRGFAPFIECNQCKWVPQCVNCDVSLTYHKKKNELKCHYCGYSTPIVTSCMQCQINDLRMRGFGTERIEEELQLLLPDARTERLDYDTTRSKSSFQNILGKFAEGEIDVLVGTQMVTKGLDFYNVALVGIISADSLLFYPDFRAHERCFQLLAQVSGRAGRKVQDGRVLIQTYNPTHPVLKFVLNHDFRGFYKHELTERYNFHYPPYTRLIEIRIKHRDEIVLEQAVSLFAGHLRHVFGKRVMGPTVPHTARVRNLFIRTILLKLEKTLSVSEVKNKLQLAVTEFLKPEDHRRMIVQIDVDPV